jgi:hypothetical protein
MKFTGQLKDHRSIIFVQAKNEETFESAIAKIAINIGFDTIEDPFRRREIWKTMSLSDRLEAFNSWLDRSCNEEVLLIVDDLNAFGQSDVDKILDSLAQKVIVSTRQPELGWIEERQFTEIQLPELDIGSVVNIMESKLRPSRLKPPKPEDLISIAYTLHGHPLAASLVIPFISQYLAKQDDPAGAFVKLFKSSNSAEREQFFKFNMQGRSLSLWESFEISYTRLRDNSGRATALMELLPFLKTDSDLIYEFLDQEMDWLKEFQDELPNISILDYSSIEIAVALSELRAASFYMDYDPLSTKKLNFHPLVLDFAQLRSGIERRVSLAKQVFIFCYEFVTRTKNSESLIHPHAKHCLEMCDRFDIKPDTLGLPDHVLKLLSKFQPSLNSGEAKPRQTFARPDTPVENASNDSGYHAHIQDYITQCTEARVTFEVPKYTALSSHTRESHITLVAKLVRCYNIMKERLKRLPLGPSNQFISGIEGATNDLIFIVEQVRSGGGTSYPNLLLDLENFKQNINRSLPIGQ